ncbi:efflux RND transporter permease subunit [Azorhizophilus paspali]|uniref:Efflux RND transporter permease subunit n=1 Tax=Azorhizophilus paspali TaxID=69963 RepID=A0ABV6SR04_AZOPA
MLGLLPMALSHEIGSKTQRPQAIVVIGGLVMATLLTLVVVPALYVPGSARRGDPPEALRAFPTLSPCCARPAGRSEGRGSMPACAGMDGANAPRLWREAGRQWPGKASSTASAGLGPRQFHRLQVVPRAMDN